MVGQVGTEQMTGVAIVNQLIFVYNLCIFGGVSGAGIFTAQFFGQKDDEGVANTMRFKLYMGCLLYTSKMHCLFMMGLGKLGMGQKKEAEEYFSQILKTDGNHQGALNIPEEV